MADVMEQSGRMDSTNLGVDRTSATVKGGRRFSFGALVVVGDRRGQVGYGYAKANEVPNAIEKAEKYAKRVLVEIPLVGTTIPHEVEGKFSSAKVRLVPAAPGTGVVARQVARLTCPETMIIGTESVQAPNTPFSALMPPGPVVTLSTGG